MDMKLDGITSSWVCLGMRWGLGVSRGNGCFMDEQYRERSDPN